MFALLCACDCRWCAPPEKRYSSDQWINVGDIEAINIGRSTPLFQKRGKDKLAPLYVSIVTSMRTLDLQVRVCVCVCVCVGVCVRVCGCVCV